MLVLHVIENLIVNKQWSSYKALLLSPMYISPSLPPLCSLTTVNSCGCAPLELWRHGLVVKNYRYSNVWTDRWKMKEKWPGIIVESLTIHICPNLTSGVDFLILFPVTCCVYFRVTNQLEKLVDQLINLYQELYFTPRVSVFL